MSNKDNIGHLFKRIIKYFSFVVLLFILFSVGIWIAWEILPKKEYHLGDGFSGETLVIHFHLLYRHSYGNDIGSHWSQYGFLTSQNNQIVLHPIYSQMDDGWSIPRDNLIIVKWGKREYLISSSQFVGFCNSYNLGYEPRTKPFGSHFLAEDDWKVDVTGLPEVPESYQRYLLKKPIDCSVVKILDSMRISVNVGSQQGVFKDMVLLGDHYWGYVDSVDNSFSFCKRAEYSQNAFIGQVLTTSITNWKKNINVPANQVLW